MISMKKMIKKIMILGMAVVMLFSFVALAGCRSRYDLAEYKVNAIQQLQEFSEEAKLNLSEFAWPFVQYHIDNGIDAINAAYNRTAVRSASRETKDIIENITLEDYKALAITALENYVAALQEEETLVLVSPPLWRLQNGIRQIGLAIRKQQVISSFNEAKEAIRYWWPTLKGYQRTAVAQLQVYPETVRRGESKYSSENWLAIQNYIATGVANIRAALSKADVRETLRMAIYNIDNVATLPWVEMPFALRAATSEWGSFTNNPNYSPPRSVHVGFFDYAVYETTRPTEYGVARDDEYSDSYRFFPNIYNVFMISSTEELSQVLREDNFWLMDELAELSESKSNTYKYLLQLYDEAFFEKNILILYNWIARFTYSFLDAVKIYDSTIKVNVSQYLIGGFSIVPPLVQAHLAIEVCRSYVVNVTNVKVETYRFWSIHRQWPSFWR